MMPYCFNHLSNAKDISETNLSLIEDTVAKSYQKRNGTAIFTIIKNKLGFAYRKFTLNRVELESLEITCAYIHLIILQNPSIVSHVSQHQKQPYHSSDLTVNHHPYFILL